MSRCAIVAVACLVFAGFALAGDVIPANCPETSLARHPDHYSWEEITTRLPNLWPKILKGLQNRPVWTDEERASIDGHYPDRADLHIIGLLALIFSIFRPIFQYGLLRTMGRKMGLSDRDSVRFAEALFQVLFYSIMMYWGIKICLTSHWYLDFDFWKDCPNHVLTSEARAYYVVQFAFYMHSILFLFAENKKKDFLVMLTHHIATVLVMTLAYVVNYTRVGLAVLMVHDPADVFLNLAKLFNYFKMKRACDGVFMFFALVWLLTRLTLFPCIVASAWNELYYQIKWHNWMPFESVACPILLTILLVLHVYWFYLIFRMIIRALRAGEVEQDIRSDSDEEGSSAKEKREKKKHR